MRKTALIAVALVAALFGTLVPATAAEASTRVLCVGYNACAKAGYSSHGYKPKRDNLYWRMAGDHNCTNYVAYLLVSKGMVNVRPWSGDGNAYAWGDFTKDYRDSTPVVGAVAWWDANRAPASSTGHVSYVERVISKNEIIVSEDNWKGEFRWKRITKSGGGWPSAFIHFKDSRTPALPALSATVTGQSVWADSTKKVAVVSSALRPGSTAWVELTYRNTGAKTWKGVSLVTTTPTARVSALSAGWISPTTATKQKEKTVAPGKVATFGFAVTIPMDAAPGTIWAEHLAPRSASGTVMTQSDAWVQFGADDRADFATRPTPTIAGKAKEGQLLTADPGVWPAEAALSYVWKRNGVGIARATGASYTPTALDVGKRLTVTVSAAAGGYLPSLQTSAPTVMVGSIESDRLLPNQVLAVNGQLISPNGQYQLTQRDDGNLVIYDRLSGIPLWASATEGVKVRTKLTTKGALLVLSSAGATKWTTGSTKGVKAVLKNDGTFGIYSKKGTRVWSSSTSGR